MANVRSKAHENRTVAAPDDYTTGADVTWARRKIRGEVSPVTALRLLCMLKSNVNPAVCMEWEASVLLQVFGMVAEAFTGAEAKKRAVGGMDFLRATGAEPRPWLDRRSPVCPRCLGIEPGTPAGDPEQPDPAPYTEGLCNACETASAAAARALKGTRNDVNQEPSTGTTAENMFRETLLEDALDRVISLARKHRGAEIDASMCGTSTDFRRAREAEEAFHVARDAFLARFSAEFGALEQERCKSAGLMSALSATTARLRNAREAVANVVLALGDT